MMTTLHDILSHLTFRQACKLLGPNGKSLITAGGQYEIEPEMQVEFKDDRFELALGQSTASITLDPARPDRLRFS